MDISNYSDLLSINEVCEILRCTRMTLHRRKPYLIEHGVKFIVTYPNGKCVRIDRDSLFEFLDQKMVEQMNVEE
jgi:hypothetical protein